MPVATAVGDVAEFLHINVDQNLTFLIAPKVLIGGRGDGVDRVASQFRVISYPTARGCVAAYFPEANSLVPLDQVAEGSNTPVSKSIVVRLETVAVTVPA